MGFVDDEQDFPFVHQKNKYDINTKLMINVLISISIVVFLVTILRLYIRSLFRRRQAQGQATSYTTRISRISNVTSVSQVEPPKNGLDRSIMTSLPKFVYKKSDPHDHDIIECSICLSIIEDGELVRILPNCKHNFHVECIDKWFNCHSTCPICRTEAEPRLLPETREGVVSRMTPSMSPMDSVSICVNLEETSSSGNESTSRLSSFKRIILSKERLSQRLQIQSCSREDHVDDPESGRSRI